MEKFTRECLELEESGTQGANSMEKVYERAAKLVSALWTSSPTVAHICLKVKRALDIEGATVLDISHLECVESTCEDGTKSYSFRGDTFTDPTHVPAPVVSSPSVHGTSERSGGGAGTPDRPFERISAPVVLGSAHTNFRGNHVTSISGIDHERLSTFLSYVQVTHVVYLLLTRLHWTVRTPTERFMNMLYLLICATGQSQLAHPIL